MQKCTNCSAPLQDLVEQCTFCGTLTDRGVQVRQQQAMKGDAERHAAEQRAAADQVRARQAAQSSVDSAGRWALYSSLLGSLLCCFVPVGPVLGIVFGMRARGLAAQHRLAGAGLGTTGLVFGVVGLVCSMTLWIAAGVMMVNENKHRGELKAALGDLTAHQLELRSACALTELELLDTRYEGYSSLDDFECGSSTSDLELNGDEAVLRGVQFVKGQRRVPVVACLHHRNKWSVKQLRGDDDCSAPKEATPRKVKHD
jgi:hypothetical protein